MKRATLKQCKYVWALLKSKLEFDDFYCVDFIAKHTGKRKAHDLTNRDIKILLKQIDKESKQIKKDADEAPIFTGFSLGMDDPNDPGESDI